MIFVTFTKGDESLSADVSTVPRIGEYVELQSADTPTEHRKVLLSGRVKDVQHIVSQRAVHGHDTSVEVHLE